MERSDRNIVDAKVVSPLMVGAEIGHYVQTMLGKLFRIKLHRIERQKRNDPKFEIKSDANKAR